MVLVKVATNNELSKLIGPYAELVEAGLRKYLGQLKGPKELIEAMSYAVLGPGKRIRPVLALMCNEVCGQDSKHALGAACAVEMVHAYSLVHDDLPSMDNDDMRRGRATCHKVYGEAMAILVGDALLTEAFGIISAESISPDLAAALVRELVLGSGICGMVSGQAADMLSEGSKGNIEMLEYIHSHKTAKLIRAACRMGALTGRASKEQFAALSRYGQALGMAFQVIDDLLDLEGDAQTLGKAVGKDDQAGKLTYPSVLGARAAREKVEELGQEAAASLETFDKGAGKLLLLAELLGQRVV